MNIESIKKILVENSLNESINIENVEGFIGDLIKEGNIKSAVKEICYTVPMKRPTGYVFGAKKEGDVLKIVRNGAEVENHLLVTEITKEVIDDLYSQFGEDASTLLADLVKRDMAIDQDQELFDFIDKMARIQDSDLTLPEEDFEASLVKLQGYIDEVGLKIAADVKATTGSVIIGTPKVIGLLLKDDLELTRKQEKMYSYAGSLGSRDLFVDFESDEEYLTVGVNGDDTLRGVTFCPYNIATNWTTKYQDGVNVMRVNNRYTFVRNPLDNPATEDNNSKFFVKTIVVFDEGTINMEEFTEAFEAAITPEVDPQTEEPTNG